jgi:hypothetical protein
MEKISKKCADLIFGIAKEGREAAIAEHMVFHHKLSDKEKERYSKMRSDAGARQFGLKEEFDAVCMSE